MSGGAGGGGVGWAGHGHGAIGGYVARQRATNGVLDATEAMMREDGIEVPARPWSQTKVFFAGFASGLFLGLLIGLIFWELT